MRRLQQVSAQHRRHLCLNGVQHVDGGVSRCEELGAQPKIVPVIRIKYRWLRLPPGRASHIKRTNPAKGVLPSGCFGVPAGTFAELVANEYPRIRRQNDQRREGIPQIVCVSDDGTVFGASEQVVLNGGLIRSMSGRGGFDQIHADLCTTKTIEPLAPRFDEAKINQCFHGRMRMG